MPQIGRDPVVHKNHIVSHYDILLSLGLKFEEQEGAGPSIIFLYKKPPPTFYEDINDGVYRKAIQWGTVTA